MITKEEWKNKYGKFVWAQIDTKFYKQSLKQLKKNIFTKDRLQKKRSIIIEDNTKKVFELDKHELEMVKIIRNNLKNICSIPKNKERMFVNARQVLITSEQRSIIGPYIASNNIRKFKRSNNFFLSFTGLAQYLGYSSSIYSQFFANGDFNNQLASRIAFKEKLTYQIKNSHDYNQVVELTAMLDGVKKRIEEDTTKAISYDYFRAIYLQIRNNPKKRYFIELTYDIRKIASQSTKVGWHSCMNLDMGENLRFVPTGIAAGVFIAYMRNNKQDFARVLCKPYVAKRDGKLVYKWVVSSLYWDQNTFNDRLKVDRIFRAKVQDYLNNIYKPVPAAKYALIKKVYNDREPFILDQNNTRYEDQDLYEDLASVADVKDFNNFDGFMKGDPQRIVKFLLDGFLNEINHRTNYFGTYLTIPNIEKYLSVLQSGTDKFSYGSNAFAAYCEIFEDICYGTELNAVNFYNLLYSDKWNYKLRDVENLFRIDVNFTDRYKNLLTQRRVNTDKILLKHGVDKIAFTQFVRDKLTDSGRISNQIQALVDVGSEEILYGDIDTVDKLKALESSRPEAYKKIKEWFDDCYFAEQEFEQYWD